MKYIPKIFINNLLLSTDIIKLISSKINLQKFGNKYKCCCPFHKEKNPSFFVNEEKKFFYCFGCKIYGNSIDFLMKFNNINFFESIKELSEFNGIKLILNKNINNNKFLSKKLKYFKIMFSLSKIYHNFLFKNLKLNFIKNFFIKRNINIKMIKEFFLGYSSIDLFNHLLKFFNEKEIFFLIKLGLLVKNKKNNIYDKLNNRIIFPIFDVYNRVIAFGGRSINRNFFLKYINSSTNIFFFKKKCLYGLNNVKKNKIKIDKILIVEGYIDVITLHKNKILYAVGLLGSSISKEQIKILYFYTNILIFCFDGDKSGFNSIKKTLKLLLIFINEIKKAYFIFLPNKEDPDSIIKKEGKKKFKNRIKNSKSIFYVLFKIYLFKENINSYEKKFYFSKKILFLINKIKSPIIKLFLNRELCLRVGLHKNDFDNLINLNFLKFKKKKNILILLVRYLISLLLKNLFLSKLVNIYDIVLNLINKPILSLFLNIINLCILNNIFTFNEILNKFSKNFIRFYLEYLFLKNYFSININDKIYFLNFLDKLKIFLIDLKLDMIFKKNVSNKFSFKEKKKIWYLIKLKNFKK